MVLKKDWPVVCRQELQKRVNAMTPHPSRHFILGSEMPKSRTGRRVLSKEEIMMLVKGWLVGPTSKECAARRRMLSRQEEIVMLVKDWRVGRDRREVLLYRVS